MSEVNRYVVDCNRLWKDGHLQTEVDVSVVLSADFDRVTAELASANSDKDAYAQNAIDLRKRVDALQALLTAADERAAELERDAARYRWLRDPDNRDDLEPEEILVVGIAEGEDIVWLERMDQAIDTNLEALKPADGSTHD